VIGGSIVMFIVFSFTKEEDSDTPIAGAPEEKDYSSTGDLDKNKRQPEEEVNSDADSNIYTKEKTKKSFITDDNDSLSTINVAVSPLSSKHSVETLSSSTRTAQPNKAYQIESISTDTEEEKAINKTLSVNSPDITDKTKTKALPSTNKKRTNKKSYSSELETITNSSFRSSIKCKELKKYDLYDEFFFSIKDVFNYPNDLDTSVLALCNFIEEKERKSIFSRMRSWFTWRHQNSLKNLLDKDITQALTFYFSKAEIKLNYTDLDNNKSVFEKAFADTLNLIRYSETYKSKLKSKKGSQEIQIKLFNDDNIESKKKINFKSPVKHKNKIYRFDTLNLIMNNEPMKNYILQTIEKDSAEKLKEIMDKQADSLTDNDFEYIETFKNFSGEPLDFFKELLIDKRRSELEKHSQLHMGSIEYSILDQTTKTFQFKYNQILNQHEEKDNETPELPLITLIPRYHTNKGYIKIPLSIQDLVLNDRYPFDFFINRYNILHLKKLSFFLNQFPFLIIQIEKTETLQRESDTLELICEKKLMIPDINEGLNEYELTGFMMENKESADKSASYLECFNICNDEIQGVSQKNNKKNVSLKMVVFEIDEDAIYFYFKQESILKIKYLIYKKISKAASNEE
ncbi:hypothetical protein CDIK_2639, partial [Cucumispora dikerogammari]